MFFVLNLNMHKHGDFMNAYCDKKGSSLHPIDRMSREDWGKFLADSKTMHALGGEGGLLEIVETAQSKMNGREAQQGFKGRVVYGFFSRNKNNSWGNIDEGYCV